MCMRTHDVKHQHTATSLRAGLHAPLTIIATYSASHLETTHLTPSQDDSYPPHSAHVMAINDVDNPAHFNFDLSGHHPYIRGIDMRTSEPYPLAWSGDFFNPTVVICRGEIVCAVVFFVACKDELVCGAIFHPLSPGRWRQGIASVGYSNTRGTYGMIQMGRFHVGAGMENSLTDCIELLKHKFNDSKPSIDSLDLCTDGRFAAGLVDAIIGLE